MRAERVKGPVLRIRVDARTTLDLLQPADTDALHALVDANRAHLARWLPWAASETREGVADFIAMSRERFEEEDGFDLGIRRDGALVGVIGLHYVDRVNRRTSIGYWLAEDAQGQGLMRASVETLLAHCFGEMHLHRVEIRVAPDNARSLAIPRAFGFREEGVLRDYERLDDKWLDLVVFSLLSTEYANELANKPTSR